MAIYHRRVHGHDLETGRILYDIDKWTFTNVEDRRNYTQADPMRDALGANLPDNYTGTEVFYCPGTSARNWQNDAYSPRTGLLYTIVNTSCSRFRMIEGDMSQGWTSRGAGAAAALVRRWIIPSSRGPANNPLYNQDGAYRWPDALPDRVGDHLRTADRRPDHGNGGGPPVHRRHHHRPVHGD
jgi:hypothetical protein